MKNRLLKYGFRDKHGHPLENCRDYLEMDYKDEGNLPMAVFAATVITILAVWFFIRVAENYDFIDNRRVANKTRIRQN